MAEIDECLLGTAATYSVIACLIESTLFFCTRTAALYRPKLLVCGASAYARLIDFKRMRATADAQVSSTMEGGGGAVAAGFSMLGCTLGSSPCPAHPAAPRARC